MKYCKECLTTNLRPNASFNENGVCIACEYSNNESTKSFTSELKLLKKMIRHTRSKRKRHELYD